MKDWSQADIKNAQRKIGHPTGIWFFTKNIDETFQNLKSKGVDITLPTKQIWGGVMSTIFDQDKNSFGLVGDSKN